MTSQRTYTVYLPHVLTEVIRGVPADSEDEALDQVQSTASLCSSCEQHLELAGEPEYDNAVAFIEDEDARKL